MAETTVGGFRLAAVFDKVDPVTGPAFERDHPRLADGPERAVVADYLRSGPHVLMTPMLMDDVLDPERRGVVPMSYRTDGEWIWTDTIAYYLDEYGLAPESGLLAHIRAQGEGPRAEPPYEVLEQAVAFILTPPEPAGEPVWNVGQEQG
ncbi:hypothetical protein OG455_09870 [Kitasatospora sp. NBC_01287]|uniref:hypothetical protein n=1 Tax=Kitasatospora sp. NBC_01287 TaxID=2903573 RepID=UPI0022553A70|nr:hypothetical protein [Kitasatospora sp. NBC_01287]MCX4745827.1 hypothetical protein [Kitasatospora sp. NBC_01287]